MQRALLLLPVGCCCAQSQARRRLRSRASGSERALQPIGEALKHGHLPTERVRLERQDELLELLERGPTLRRLREQRRHTHALIQRESHRRRSEMAPRKAEGVCRPT